MSPLKVSAFAGSLLKDCQVHTVWAVAEQKWVFTTPDKETLWSATVSLQSISMHL